MLANGERPRELRWYHAGPMLFGDWGTSRLYVLGLAYAFTGRASFWFVAAMGGLMIGVGWCYEMICRLFPDGGGVYSAARHRSQLLAVVGGLLLCADYVVTAAMSCLDAFHYLGASLGLDGLAWAGLPAEAVLAAATILLIGGLNLFGPTKTGTIAMVVALATVGLTLVIGLCAVPHLGAMRVESPFARGYWQSWVGFTEIVLALSGVEAIANMTGIMVQPVARTARKAITPVLIEIVTLNLVLAAAMNALPDSILNAPDPSGVGLAHTADMLRVIALVYVGPAFAVASSFVFAALLLSAVNTALADLVSIQFMLSRDKELPSAFGRLNRYGMPVWPLAVGAVVPALVVLLYPNVEALAGLYAIGVVGAISINLASTSTDPTQPLKGWERRLMQAMAAIMIAIGVTIAGVKPHARGFALVVLVLGLAARLATIALTPATAMPRRSRVGYVAFAATSAALALVLAAALGHTWASSALTALVALGVGGASRRTQPYRAALVEAERAAALTAAAAGPRMLIPGAYAPRERLLVATQGNPRLLEFALRECQGRRAELMLLFVRHLAVLPMGPTPAPRLDEDEPALALFEEMRQRARAEGVPLRLLYGVARDIPDAILDTAVTHGADLVLLGTSRRGTLWRAMKGDVIQGVAEHLPESIGLLIHA